MGRRGADLTVYVVRGKHAYREHVPGATFEATLESAAEQRALERGDIEILERSTTTIQPGSYTLPAGWPTSQQSQED
jgi:hypothetical protein